MPCHEYANEYETMEERERRAVKRRSDDVLLMLSACTHLDDALSVSHDLHNWYNAICSRLVYPVEDRFAVTRANFLRCRLCPPEKRLACQPLLTCCTQCNTFVCLQHMPAHLRDTRHGLAMSLETGHIYCLICADFVYSPCLNLIKVQNMNLSRKRMGMSRISCMEDDSLTVAQRNLLQKPLNVRGLYNLGNTCYMNCVLQAIIHTPLLKRHLLLNHFPCQQPKGRCFLCELVKLVDKMNTADDYAFTSPQLLYLLWKLAPHLAGYRQHDAQEFFLAAHDLMHRHYQAPTQKIENSCHCVMHTVFGGQTSSKGVCTNCRNQWISGDGLPFVDVQLIVPELSRKVHLKECLNEFCREETILDYSCPRCGTKPVVRQTSFSRLPSVLVLHLKRFKLSPAGDTDSTKVNTEVSYDLQMDMSEYLTSFDRDRAAFDTRTSLGLLNRRNHSYSLFAIVSHSGSMQVGHYVSYVKTNTDLWWRCDDQVVTRVDKSQVTNVEAYMLFYQLSRSCI